MSYYVTGDCHGDFKKIVFFCEHHHTSKDDYMIILGDVELNYWLNQTDRKNKDKLSELPLSFLMIRGNHEAGPGAIPSYREKQWKGGIVYYEEEYPSLLFAKDGEIYDFDGKKGIAIGGAYSVDKEFRICAGLPWFADEQPSIEIREYVEQSLSGVQWQVDYVFTHTCPEEMMPTDLFLDFISQKTVDRSTEKWLSRIFKRLSFHKWYFGHYHDDREYIDFCLLYAGIYELGGVCAQLVGCAKYIRGDIVLFAPADGEEQMPGKIKEVNEFGDRKQSKEVSYDIIGVDRTEYEGVPESAVELVDRAKK